MQRKFQKLLFHFEVSTVAADSIALLGAKASAGIAMTKYRQVSNIRGTLVGNKIVDHSDVVGASPVGAAPSTSSFST